MEKSGLYILFGTALTVTGVALCGWSGYRRESEAKSQGRGAGFSSSESAMAQTGSTPKQYILYLAIAVISGVLSSLLNIALAYSTGILEKVAAQGGRAGMGSVRHLAHRVVRRFCREHRIQHLFAGEE